MLKTYLKSSIRSIFRRKLYSSINIFGLSVGLAAFILIAVFVRHELSYDKYNVDYQNIYRVVRNEYSCSPPAMAAYLKENIAEIESSAHFIRSTNLLASVNESYFTEDEYFWTDNEFFNIFSIDLIQGDRENILKSTDDILISESIARKYFGTADPMGQMVTVSRQYEYRVAGVFKDYPGNSHYRFDVVLPVDRYYQITNNTKDSWSSNYTYTYVKIHDGAELSRMNERMVEIEKELTGWTEELDRPYEQYFFFQPISEIHLYSHRQQEVQVNGNIRNVYIFSSIALLILLIASINYINISTAIASDRTKEVGIRKIMGIKTSQLIKQFLTESTLIAIVSIALALVLTGIFLPLFGDLMQRELSIRHSDIPLMILLVVVLILIVGLGTGLIPSRSISGVSAISVIKGSKTPTKGLWKVRDILVMIQFMVAIILVILTLNVKRQINYISDMDPGYDKEQIVNLRIFDRSIRTNLQLIKDELSRINNVALVSTSYNLPNNITDFTRPEWFCDNAEDCTPISYNPVDYNFSDLYNIEIVEGRNFSKDYPSDASGAFLLNEKAVAIAGWDSPLGMELSHWDGQKGNVVGVMKDFHFRSMHTDIAPLYLFLDENINSYISIKISGVDIPGTLKSIASTFDRFSPGAPFHYTFFDEEFAMAYNNDKRMGSIFAFFGILAIALGCLGLFGMSSYTIAKRTREIGVRKVFGASGAENFVLLLKSFLLPVMLANLIAWPLAFYSTQLWLEGFAFKAGISVWTFILATFIVAIIAIATVASRGISISNHNPSESLRHE